MQKLHDRKNVGKVILDPAQAPKPKPATPLKGKKANSVDKEEKKKEDEAKEGGEAAGDAPEKKDNPEEKTNGENASWSDW